MNGRLARVLGIALLLVGAVWIAQGLGVLPGSFMTGQLQWAGYGALAAGLGALLVWRGMRGGRP
jgi:hypothetical protein